jgi:HlyD family secretion protein
MAWLEIRTPARISMATGTERDRNAALEPQRPASDRERASDRARRGVRSKVKVVGLGFGLFGLLAVGVVLFSGVMQNRRANELAGASTQRVTRGPLVVTVTEDGNLESSANVDVSCQLAGGGTIIWIVPDGSMVEVGQELVRLNQATIEDQLNAQKIVYEKARATKIQADQDYRSAITAVREYDEGTSGKDLEAAESQVNIALQNLRSAENILTHSDRMFRKGYVSALQLEADKYAVKRCELDLKAAKTVQRVLLEFTRPKTLNGLQATRDAAEAKAKAEEAGLKLEKDKLERLVDQLKLCVIKAPQRGMVVYATPSDYWDQNAIIRAGAAVRERQVLVRLPDTTKMQVKATVHESKINMIRPGMPARVVVQGKQWIGKVVSTGNQPEPSGWFTASIKRYATIISIDGDTTGLKPGMTAQAEILVADLENILTVPVSAVVELDGKFFAWVKEGGGAQSRPLLLGQTNDQVIEITDGLKEGDEVILNPRAVVAEAQQGGTSPVEMQNTDRFGIRKNKTSPSTGAKPTVDRAKASGSVSQSKVTTRG